jgi:hypothetical protein
MYFAHDLAGYVCEKKKIKEKKETMKNTRK